MSSPLRYLFSVALAVGLVPVSASHSQVQRHTPRQASAPSTAEDIRTLKSQLESLQTEIAEIKKVLHTQAATLPIGVTRSPSLPQNISQTMVLPFVPDQGQGLMEAPFVLVEFGDLQCPFCNDFSKRTLPSFIESYVKSGKVRLLSAEFPLESHPKAVKLSLANLCSGEQHKYWEMRDALMNTEAATADDAIAEAARFLTLNQEELLRCISSPLSQESLDKRVAQAKDAGVYSTPAFLFGRIENGTIKGITFAGDLPLAEFTAQIETSMKQILETKHDPQSKMAKVK